MPALPTIVSDFLTKVKNDLSVGSDLATPGSGNIRGAAMNFLRAQDMASVLELLQDALSNPIATGIVTFTGVPTADDTLVIGGITYTWVAAPAAAFDIDIGADAPGCVTNLVAAILAGAGEGTVYGTGTTAHPDVTAADGTGDTVDIASIANGAVGNAVVFTESMDNATISGSGNLAGGSDGILLTATNPGTVRTFQDGVAASGVVTFTGVPTADDTLTIGTTVYTWVAAPAVAFDVDIGGDADTCVTNLVAAILAGAGEGTLYGTGTTAHPDVVAADGTGSTVDLTAINTGVAGNAIVFTESMDNATISGSGDLAGGVAAFVANAHVGDTFTFDAATTTTALQGLSFTVITNTDGVLTFAEVMPAASVVGDDGLLTSTLVSVAIDDLREGSGLADAPRGSVYGEMRIVTDALNRLIVQLGDTPLERNLGRAGLETVAGSTTVVINIDNFGVPYRVDEFRGAKCVVTGSDARTVVTSNETSVTLNVAISAPGAGVAVALTVPADSAHKTYGKIVTHPGGQPGENIYLADQIRQAQDAVVAFTLPV